MTLCQQLAVEMSCSLCALGAKGILGSKYCLRGGSWGSRAWGLKHAPYREHWNRFWSEAWILLHEAQQQTSCCSLARDNTMPSGYSYLVQTELQELFKGSASWGKGSCAMGKKHFPIQIWCVCLRGQQIALQTQLGSKAVAAVALWRYLLSGHSWLLLALCSSFPLFFLDSDACGNVVV